MTSCPRRLRYSNQIRKEISRKVATGAGRASGKSSPLARGNCGWATIQTRKTADPNCSTVSLQDMLYHVCLIQVYIYNFTYLLPVSHRNPNFSKCPIYKSHSCHVSLESAQMTCGRQGGKPQKTFCPGNCRQGSSRWGVRDANTRNITHH